MVLRLNGVITRLIALLLLLAVCAPYAAAAMPHAHEECGMEMCKRSGKCCCKRPVRPGKPLWEATDPCVDSPHDASGFAGPQAEVRATAWEFGDAVVSARVAVAYRAVGSIAVAFDLFSRPPPVSL